MERHAHDSDSAPLDATLDEHRGLMETVSAVEGCLDSPPDREGKWRSALVSELARLTDALRCHFGTESQGALYQEIPERFPRFAQRLRDLEAEHASILADAESVLKLGREETGDRIYEQRRLNARAQLLVATLRRHEAEENEIILSAHWDEVGAGD